MNFINKKSVFVLLCLLYLLSMCRCDSKNICEEKSIIDNKLGYIGDSIICNNLLSKIVFNDSLFLIDSMVFTWYDNKKIESQFTYSKGIKVYENILYSHSGSPSIYTFVSDVSPNYFYKIEYDSSGKIISKTGEIFFHGYLDKINAETLEVIDDGNKMHLQIYYPNAPHCSSNVYVKFDTGNEDVFLQNEHLSFVKDVWINTKKHDKDWTLVDIWLEQNCDGDTLFYNKPLYYKVVDSFSY